MKGHADDRAAWRALVSPQCGTDVMALPQVRPAGWSVGICVSSDHNLQWLLVGVDAAHGLLHVLQHEFHRRNLSYRAGAMSRSVFASTCTVAPLNDHRLSICSLQTRTYPHTGFGVERQHPGRQPTRVPSLCHALEPSRG